jgi:hypothetical protein
MDNSLDMLVLFKKYHVLVLNHVFDDINQTQYGQVYAGQTHNFSEIIWYYCSSSSNQIDRYVIYNTSRK